MPESEDQKEISNTDLRNSQFGGGFINADNVNAGRIGGDIHITNYYYREDIQLAAVKPAEDASSDEKLPCPYRGLFHFSPDDAEYFFGREVFIEELFSATKTRNFIPVLGASGSGKSSVVLAGLVPKLQEQGNWQFTHFRPSDGYNPFYALAQALVPLYISDLDSTDQITQATKLAEALSKGESKLSYVFSNIQRKHTNCRVLLIADQFEELYTSYSDEIHRSFLDCLLEIIQSPTNTSSSSGVLVATMRADFLGNALSYRPFADVLQNADIKLGAMNRCELSQVIEKPVDKLGVVFEEGLVQRILDDVEDAPGNLPLLEFALMLLWKQRNGKQLTHAAYEAIGQVKGALANYADKEYGKLAPTEQTQARRIFIQLVRPGEGAEDTRRLATHTELGEKNWELITRKNGLADSRLVVTGRDTTGQQTVEVIHEVLIRNWGELRQWMKADRNFRAWQERLRIAMQQWQDKQQDQDALLRGALLAEAEQKLQERPEELGRNEQEFIQASIKLRDREQKREKRRHRLTILVLTSFSVVTLGFSVVAGWQWRQSVKAQIDILTQSSLNSLNFSKQLDALVTSVKAGKELKLLLMPEDKIRTEVLSLMRQGISEVREQNTLIGHGNTVIDVVFSPDGQKLASASFDQTIKIWDAATGEELGTLTGHSDSVNSVVFSPDGRFLASASSDKTIKIWDAATGEELGTLTGHSDSVNSVVFSPDGRFLASASSDKTIKIWIVATGKPLKTLTGHSDSVNSVVFSPDGQKLASASFDQTIKVWDVATGKPLKTLKGHSDSVNSIIFSPDGRFLASASSDKTIKIWDAAKGEELGTLTGHSDSINSVIFSPEGQKLTSASLDRTVRIWDVDTGEELSILTGHDNTVTSVVFSPEGQKLASASLDRTVRIWDFTSGKGHNTLIGHDNTVTSVVFSSDGQKLASASLDTNIKIWDIFGNPLGTLEGHSDSVNSVVFSPDGQKLASASSDKTIKIWDVLGNPLKTLSGHSDLVNSVVFSPEGQKLASASSDKTIKIWDVATGKPLKTISGHSDAVNSVVFSPEGQKLASASSDKTIKIWDVATGKPLKTISGHSDAVISVVFSPEGQKLASASSDKTIKIWDVATGKLLNTLKGHSNAVSSIVFSPDGQKLASTSSDKTIKIWDVATGKLLNTLKGHKNNINTVVFSPDGQKLASASDDKTIILWNLTADLWKFDLDNLLVRHCHWVRGYLQNNFNVSENDKHLCDDVERDWIAEGEEQARTGDIEGAVTKFQKAQEQNPNLTLEPQKKARQLAARAMIEKSERLMVRSEGKEAISAYNKAQELDPKIEISAKSLNYLCWRGSLLGFAINIMDACEKAVLLQPENGDIRDSRGLAKALTGNRAAAIADFQKYIEWSRTPLAKAVYTEESLKESVKRRQNWIKTFRAGNNPFTPEELEILRQEEF